MLLIFLLFSAYGQNLDITIFSYNVKGGRAPPQNCCWTAPQYGPYARSWQIAKMKQYVKENTYDFVAMVETRDQHNKCTPIDQIVPHFRGYDSGPQFVDGWNCQTILYNTHKWKLDSNNQAKSVTSTDPTDNRNMGAIRFIQIGGTEKVVMVGLQLPHIYNPSRVDYRFISTIQSLTENGRYPVVLAGDWNHDQQQVQTILEHSGWPAKASENLNTCCAMNPPNWPNTYDHVAAMAKQGEWTIGDVSAMILPGWGISDSYSITHHLDVSLSAEHLPIAGTISLTKGSSVKPQPTPPVKPRTTPQPKPKSTPPFKPKSTSPANHNPTNGGGHGVVGCGTPCHGVTMSNTPGGETLSACTYAKRYCPSNSYVGTDLGGRTIPACYPRSPNICSEWHKTGCDLSQCSAPTGLKSQSFVAQTTGVDSSNKDSTCQTLANHYKGTVGDCHLGTPSNARRQLAQTTPLHVRILVSEEQAIENYISQWTSSIESWADSLFGGSGSGAKIHSVAIQQATETTTQPTTIKTTKKASSPWSQPNPPPRDQWQRPTTTKDTGRYRPWWYPSTSRTPWDHSIPYNPRHQSTPGTGGKGKGSSGKGSRGHSTSGRGQQGSASDSGSDSAEEDIAAWDDVNIGASGPMFEIISGDNILLVLGAIGVLTVLYFGAMAVNKLFCAESEFEPIADDLEVEH